MSRRLPGLIRSIFLLFIFVLSFGHFSGRVYSAELAPLALCTEGTIRILPLGDSITAGSSSGTPVDPQYYISYRKDLWDLLKAAGYEGSIDFVGSQQSGQFYISEGFDIDHEGHPSWTDNQIAMNIYDNGENWLGDLGVNWPHIILLHIGTNSLDTSPADVENILNEIDDYEEVTDNHITVILARIINMVPENGTVTQFNNNVQSMAEARTGDDIVIVDMEDGAGIVYSVYPDDPDGDMANTLHPWETGYEKMAEQWMIALENVFASCNNQPQITNPGLQTSAEGSSPSLQIEASDQDAGQTLSFEVTGLPPNLSINDSTGLISGTINYEAAGSSPYNVMVTVHDDGTPPRINSTSFEWEVSNTNRPPNVTNDGYLATEDQALNVPVPGVLGNDADPDGQAITAALVSPPSHGNLTLNGNGALIYTPYGNYFGLDSFTYKANDGTADSIVATANITINGVQDLPQATNPGDQQDTEGDSVTLQIVASDVDGDALSFSIAGQPPDLQIDPDTGVIAGVLTYESAAGSPYQVTVTVGDGNDSVPVTFSWFVDEKTMLFLPMVTRK